MEQSSSISVIIPTYNRKESVKKAIDSLLKSVLRPKEIIIVDDGSTDGTQDSLSEYKKKIIYLEQTNKGAAAARNKGGFTAKGDILFFLDSDCLIEENCLSIIEKEFFHDESVCLIGCQVLGITPGFFAKCHDYAHYHSFMLPVKSERRFVCGSGLAIKNNFFNQIGGFDANLRIAEDEDLGIRASELGRVEYLPEAIVFHEHGRRAFKDFLFHPYKWAKAGSVKPYLKYSKSQYNRFASRRPWYYLLLSPAIAFFVTCKIFIRHVKYNKIIIVYSPLIFLNKLIWCLGTYVYLKNEY